MTRTERWRPDIRRRMARALAALGAAAFVAAVGVSVFARIEQRRVLADLHRPGSPARWEAEWPGIYEPQAWATRAFYASAAPGDASGAGEAQRFRLAGTFVALGDPETRSDRTRKAIIDDREGARQYLVSEGDAVSGMRVVRILADRVRIVVNGRDVDLHLAYADPAAPAALRTAPEGEPGDAPDAEGGASRYGRRIAEDRWVLDRAALMGYYHDMLDHPERIIDLYGSFAAVRDDAGQIDGYHVGLGDERDFFEAVGLQAGDRIVAVNSLRMRSQARAEYFLREFVRDDLDTLVLDVERDGEMRQQVYIMR